VSAEAPFELRLKRRWPKLGRATDMAMRRRKRPAQAID